MKPGDYCLVNITYTLQCIDGKCYQLEDCYGKILKIVGYTTHISLYDKKSGKEILPDDGKPCWYVGGMDSFSPYTPKVQLEFDFD